MVCGQTNAPCRRPVPSSSLHLIRPYLGLGDVFALDRPPVLWGRQNLLVEDDLKNLTLMVASSNDVPFVRVCPALRIAQTSISSAIARYPTGPFAAGSRMLKTKAGGAVP